MVWTLQMTGASGTAPDHDITFEYRPIMRDHVERSQRDCSACLSMLVLGLQTLAEGD